MSTSLAEVIEAGGYDLSTVEDAQWFLSKKSEFEELVEFAENVIEEAKELEEDESDVVHSRFDEEHRRNCEDCRADYEDFCQDQADDARLDVMSENK